MPNPSPLPSPYKKAQVNEERPIANKCFVNDFEVKKRCFMKKKKKESRKLLKDKERLKICDSF